MTPQAGLAGRADLSALRPAIGCRPSPAFSLHLAWMD